MDNRKKALLIALVIGDGYIRVDPRGSGSKGSLNLCHSENQRAYLEHKRDLIHSLIGGVKPKIRSYIHNLNGVGYRQVRLNKAHKYFKVLRKWLYPDKYNPKYLKYLTPEALAIWYMDDGSLIANNKYPDGSCSSARTNIHTCCTKESADTVCKYFQDVWDIKFTSFKDGGNYSIRCFHREGAKFHKLIHPYVIPSMEYKQRFYYDTSAQPLRISRVMI